jgi:FkbM family methyltransferase
VKSIKNIKQKISNTLERFSLLNQGIKFTWVGNQYGGFYVNLEVLTKDSVIYSFGIGEDISFDKGIIRETGSTVYGFDPTPKSIKWVEKNKVPGFEFMDYGIGVKDGSSKLYLPKNPEHVSGSVVETTNISKEYVKIKLKTLRTIMKELGHQKIDVLKMDIEGLEYEVLTNILDEEIRINQILVEFHDRFLEDGKKRRGDLQKLLQSKRYKKFAISKSGQEVSFMHSSLYNELLTKKGRK